MVTVFKSLQDSRIIFGTKSNNKEAHTVTSKQLQFNIQRTFSKSTYQHVSSTIHIMNLSFNIIIIIIIIYMAHSRNRPNVLNDLVSCVQKHFQ